MINPRNCLIERFNYRFWKRLLDLGVSLLALMLLAPLLALIALALRLSSSAPVLFKQQRVGQYGRKFWIYKFTTMAASSADESDTQWTTSQDERVTRLGRILRPTGLDELPQLINVLCGDMSLVGPRPERPHFVEIFRRDVPGYMRRHALKPGITGWAQVCGWRGDTSIRKRVEHDLYYLQNWTFWLDLKILLLTVIGGRPAGARVDSPSAKQVKSASNSR
ncbi:MAG TPA: exopolysaccharide biosynthesis polyprenyl glycosylphosphotransferase [Terriglobia bacterium]|nr:exopolysaccharide biosynthesis polyprenyl glycosylphosphotransferase [Terriglobia bacterium]